MASGKAIMFFSTLVFFIAFLASVPKGANAAVKARYGYRLPRFQMRANQWRLSSQEESEPLEYDEFSDLPPFLQNVGNEIRDPMTKRYLGIDIPDYISASGKSDALKSMSNKMKAMGKRKK